MEVSAAQLAVGTEGARPATLGAPPQRFAFDCGGASYVVSVCAVQGDPPRVEGRIAPAEDWRDACRAPAPTPAAAP